MDGLTPEDVAREIRSVVRDCPRFFGSPVGDAADALESLTDAFVRVFMERNKAFNAVTFRRECGFTD
jgi:hypothetical protein